MHCPIVVKFDTLMHYGIGPRRPRNYPNLLPVKSIWGRYRNRTYSNHNNSAADCSLSLKLVRECTMGLGVGFVIEAANDWRNEWPEEAIRR